jgi:exosortase E/protease (VPEID-CTERM system)
VLRHESKANAGWPGPGDSGFALGQAPSHAQWFGLPQRLAFLGGLLILEALAASTWLDTASLDGKGTVAPIVGQVGPGAVQWMVAFAALWLTFAWRAGMLKARSAELGQSPFHYRLLLVHAAALMFFGGLSSLLFRNQPLNLSMDFVAAIWLAAGILAIALAACAFVPLRHWFALIRDTRWAAAYAAVGALGASLIAMASHSLWKPAARLTFGVVGAMLHPFLAGVTADPRSAIIGTPTFSVMIAPQCSGIEGIGLMLIFGTAWLWFFRQECRFPQALLLIPAGLFLMWVLNAVRIAALILIGNAGAAGIAAGGFHSQAGWISFILVALGFCLALRRIPWLMQPEAGLVVAQHSSEDPTAAYLSPFLAILAAAMISGAASAGFEWLYPLRFLAAAAALWYFRRSYADLDWRFGWLAPAIGGVVLAIWLGLDWTAGKHPASGIASGLAALPMSARIGWLVFRTLAAVITVPIAEEMAFRGFLIRRLITSDFHSLDSRRYTYVALAISSVAFGLMHGDRWLAGTAAGLLYAIAFLWRGRIGDAVVAHGTTNALLAGYVLVSGNWGFW